MLSRSARRSDMLAQARRMADAIRHRGPDDSDVWMDDPSGVVLAFRRLAIIDLSPEGRQPMTSFSGRYTIVYNGEIYNFPELRKELERAGIHFHGRSDTEVILAAVEHWGLNQTLQKINGMFAFALWDAKERQIHFARDRLGKKPLYIGWANETLVFGSELKALRAHPDFKPELSPEGFNLFLRYGYVPAPACIYKNIQSLPAGCRLTLDIRTLLPGAPFRTEPYWHHARALEDSRLRDVRVSEKSVVDEFEKLLSSCVRERMVSDVPLGAFLSGGIDSSAVVALMQSVSSQPVKTYTIGFHEQDYDEAGHARKIAAHLGTDHHEHYLGAKDALGVIPSLPDMFDEPFADISAIPTYLVAKFARQDVTVALSGDGGDEMLGGYNRHVAGPKIWDFMKMTPRPLRRAARAAITKIPPERWDSWFRAQPQFGGLMHKAGDILALGTPEEVYTHLLAAWPEPPVKNKIRPETILDDTGFRAPDSLSFAEKMMYWDALFYLPGDILTKVDRAAMAVSLEARAPLLDRRIYEYAWRLPAQYKIRGGEGKWLLRQVLKRHVPEELFRRPKQGFGVPIGAWLRGPLKEWAEDLLCVGALEDGGLFDTGKIRAAWEAHLDGRGNNAQKLWTVLMFQSWRQRWMP